MLTQAIETYIALKQALGYSFRRSAALVRSFARFAEASGDPHVRSATVLQWAHLARSVKERDARLKAVIAFAVHAQAEDAGHELPPKDIFGYRKQRPTPFLFTPLQIRQLLEATRILGTPPSWRPRTYRVLLGLLASTGLRISEALRLRLKDWTSDGLLIRQTKFAKSRLVPLHPTVSCVLRDYLADRRVQLAPDDYLFIDGNAQPIRYSAVYRAFRGLLCHLGWDDQKPHPHLHSLRHTFAVRSLEGCLGDRLEVNRHVVALSTYLGHVSMEATYWYLEATPHLLRQIAAGNEHLGEDRA